jgi:hypothetical protein
MLKVDGVMAKADNLMVGLNTLAGGRDGGELFQTVKSIRELAEDFDKRSGALMADGRRTLGDISRAVNNLDKEALIRILVEPKNALLKQYQKFFQFDNVELDFSDDALDAVGDEALKRGTGARGLRAILEEVLLEVMYDLPSRSDIAQCVIDRTVVLERVTPTLVTTETGTRRSA